jgi:hypothetical protein
MTEKEDVEFELLNSASAAFWVNRERALLFRNRLVEASSKNLNQQDSLGWHFLHYVLWRYSGSEDELETLKCLLGPDVLYEDHSRLRLDTRIWRGTSSYISTLPLKADGYTAMELLEFRRIGNPHRNPFQQDLSHEHYQIAHSLLQDAINRVATYPDRLLATLKDVFSLYFPTVALYSIVVDYIVWK